jgi:hypothetical protein
MGACLLVKTPFGLEREKIRATLDKKPLAKAIALAIETLQESVKSCKDDYWVSADLNVNVQRGKTQDKHVKVNVYVPRIERGATHEQGGKSATPAPENRVSIKAELEERTLAWAMAWVIHTILTAVSCEQEDYWVNLEMNVHITNGRAMEKRARINVYGDLIDQYETTIIDAVESNIIPEDILQAFCEDFRDKDQG